MKPITPEERHDALDSLALFDEPELVVLGRSELERWAECPLQAHLCEQHPGPLPGYVEAGEQTHQAFGKAIQAWIDSDGQIGPQGVRDALEQALLGSRPDLQPQVIAGARAAIWSFSQFLANEVNPQNILHFDGGEGDLSGQLAMDLPTAGVRYTGEVDMLWAGPARGMLQLEDFKSGWRFHRAGDVANSFQFQSYAVLIFANYETVQAVETRVWDTRRGSRTYPVQFERRDLDRYLGRIHAALQAYHDHRADPVPWPTVEKCERCPVARHCSASGDIGDVARDPAAALREYIALDAKLTALHKRLASYADQHGEIEAEGFGFGRRATAKPHAKVFKMTKQESAEAAEATDV